METNITEILSDEANEATWVSSQVTAQEGMTSSCAREV